MNGVLFWFAVVRPPCRVLVRGEQLIELVIGKHLLSVEEFDTTPWVAVAATRGCCDDRENPRIGLRNEM